MKVLVVDVGGSHVKFRTSDGGEVRRFAATSELTAGTMTERVRGAVHDWTFDAVSLGYPGIVGVDGPLREPGNLAEGWVGFDFDAAFGTPVRVVNDAVLQALGAYDGGRMLFLGLGTGLGSVLVTDYVVVPMELGTLRAPTGDALGDRLGRKGLEAHGRDRWRDAVADAIDSLRVALSADYVILGGGNAQQLESLPEHTRRGDPEAAFIGGVRLWQETIEPHDRRPRAAWRVVR